jgi:hypothetical protein
MEETYLSHNWGWIFPWVGRKGPSRGKFCQRRVTAIRKERFEKVCDGWAADWFEL